MLKLNKRNKLQSALTHRQSSVEISSSNKSSNEEYNIDIDNQEISFNKKLVS